MLRPQALRLALNWSQADLLELLNSLLMRFVSFLNLFRVSLTADFLSFLSAIANGDFKEYNLFSNSDFDSRVCLL